jgi:20S proteasome alpha/beta subunit
MTLVVGIEDKRNVVLASDSFVGDEECRDVLDGPKWFKLGQIWVGYAGVIGVARVAEYNYKPPPALPKEPNQAYLFRVVQGIYEAARNANLKPEECQMLMAYKGRVYSVADGGAPVRSAHGYAAVGAGEPAALAALAVTESSTMSVVDRAKQVVTAVARHNCQVATPVHVMRV